MVDVTIIVPVYNVSEYLSECMDSLINQTFEDIEIICVNDGSTDDSLEILERYRKTDERITVISQENRGLGASRNVGLKASSGDYVFFMDSDDFLELNAIELLHDNITKNKSDAAFYRAYKYTDGEKSYFAMLNFNKIFPDCDYDNFTFTYKDAKDYVLNGGYNAVLKLYKKEFLDSYPDFYFPESIAFEDILFHVKLMIRAKRLSFIPNRLYYYRYNQQSIVNTPEYAFDIFKNIEMVEQFLTENDLMDEFKLDFEYFKMKRMDFHLMKSNSEEFFRKTKGEYEKIEPNDLFKDHELYRFNTLLDSDCFAEYLIRLYNDKDSDLADVRKDNRNLKKQIDKLKKENKNLKSQNKKLSKRNDDLSSLNDEILTSNSWKVTKPLRSFKKFVR